LLGELQAERQRLEELAWGFGWSVSRSKDQREFGEFSRQCEVVAVLFNPYALEQPWPQALESILDAAPKALPIVCHGFSSEIPWPEMAEAGAFHSLRLPFDLGEVRQSLGFVWAARQRRKPARQAPAEPWLTPKPALTA
jgi:DNA-binding NtrC family response regulator